MPDIVLATLNARYIHPSLGLRCLLANLGDLRGRAALTEFILQQPPVEIVEAILALEPRIVGLGVSIWNVEPTTRVVALLKRLRPDLIVILGGPEVSHETEGQAIVALADHVITGEADLKFAEVCRELLASPDAGWPKIIPAGLPSLDQLASPYDCYTGDDLAHRLTYVEASRGCPFHCEFCLSSLDIPVRAFPPKVFLAGMQRLLDRGALRFKFVDRTFNLRLQAAVEILRFFLDRWRSGLFLHFEIVPDRLPEELRDIVRRFPPGALQFEVGIQTFDEGAAENISRRQDLARVEDNLRFLRRETSVHIHADLIAGLPGEGIESFGRGFDRLVRLGLQDIQVGILKRLRGTPLGRHDAEFRMVYAPDSPYEILSTRDIPFFEMQRLKRFARYWDIVGNGGGFPGTLELLWRDGASPFERFLRFSDWLHARLQRTHLIALHVIARSLFEFLVRETGAAPEAAAAIVEADWHRVPSRGKLRLEANFGATQQPEPGQPPAGG